MQELFAENDVTLIPPSAQNALVMNFLVTEGYADSRLPQLLKTMLWAEAALAEKVAFPRLSLLDGSLTEAPAPS